jgi:ubiquinone/menaquinone biosynthesis C-methylase UbiE
VHVVGISVSEQEVAQANARAAAEGLADQAGFQLADAANLPFPPASFDAAWALESFAYMTDKLAVLRQISQVLRPEGVLVFTDMVLTTPVGDDDQQLLQALYETLQLAGLVNADDYARLLPQARFDVVEVNDITEKTFAPTTAAIASQMLAHREQLIEAMGAEGADDFISIMTKAGQITQVGYQLIVARRTAVDLP